MSDYPFKNLVFRGGGILGIAYLGSLEVLDSDEYKILPEISRVSGASAGAITALVVSICNSAKEMKELADTLDFSKVPSKENTDHPKFPHLIKLLDEIIPGKITIEDAECVVRLLSHFGWYSSSFFYDWLKNSIQSKFDALDTKPDIPARKPGLQTFSDFKAAGFRDLFISVTNITQHTNEIFSVENQPDMAVADAVRKSMSIPLFFESIKMGDNYYADGGTVNNYPMEVFDAEKYVANKEYFIGETNWETLGCHLFTPETVKPVPKKFSLISYIKDTFMSILAAQNLDFERTPNLTDRSAKINDCNISAVDFDVTVDDKNYNNLYKSGVVGMQEYLKGYKLP